jgi:AcrR family transcriptional regulator
MDRIIPDVKSRRRYDSSGRRQQAGRNREAILEVARRLFLSEGYAATTVAAVAQASNVSVETIYKAFGGKPGLVKAIYERGLEGSGSVPAERRSDAMRSGETDPRKIIENWGAFVTEVAPLSAPILLLVKTAAASDPEMAQLLEEADRARLARMEHNARDLYERRLLREGVTLEQARDILWLYSSPELYGLLVVRQGWAIERYGRFVAGGMIAALLPTPAADASRPELGGIGGMK